MLFFEINYKFFFILKFLKSELYSNYQVLEKRRDEDKKHKTDEVRNFGLKMMKRLEELEKEVQNVTAERVSTVF